MKIENTIKIRETNLQSSGINGLSIHLPKLWLQDHNLKKGDSIEIHRSIHNEDALILVPNKLKRINQQPQ